MTNVDGRYCPASSDCCPGSIGLLSGLRRTAVHNQSDSLSAFIEMRSHGGSGRTHQASFEPYVRAPYIFLNLGMRMLQQPDKITILYVFDHEVRHVRLNQSHPAQVTPSWYGESVGHYEGDTLVIDTIGIKTGPFAMVDFYGTPHTSNGIGSSIMRRRRKHWNGTTRRIYTYPQIMTQD